MSLKTMTTLKRSEIAEDYITPQERQPGQHVA
jgi:hypothetical protein